VHNQREFTWINQSALGVYEQLKHNVTSSDVIAADMTVSSSLALLMENPMILHPQYEHTDNRTRSKIFNRSYGYTRSDYMYNYFNGLGVDYVVLLNNRCFVPVQNNINMREAIHLDFPKQTKDLFCARDFTGSSQFTVINQNDSGRILKIQR